MSKYLFFSSRKILNELSSDTPAIPRIEEEKSEEEGPGISPLSIPSSLYHSSTGQFSMFAKILCFVAEQNRNSSFS